MAQSKLNPADNLKTQLGFEFAASAERIAFPVKIGDRIGLLVSEHLTHRRRILFTLGAYLLSPAFSQSAGDLIFVRQAASGHEHELVRCNTNDAIQCTIRLRIERSIFSPVDMGDGRIVFSSSDLITGADGVRRYAEHDFWISEGDQARRLSQFKFYQLGAISISRDSISFSAIGQSGYGKKFSALKPFGEPQSDVFLLPFDAKAGRVDVSVDPRDLDLQLKGVSTKATLSSDGRYVALLNANYGFGRFRYDLVLADLVTRKTQRIESTGLGFSRPTIVGREIFVNEIFDNKYVVKAFSLDGSVARQVDEIFEADLKDVSREELPASVLKQ